MSFFRRNLDQRSAEENGAPASSPASGKGTGPSSGVVTPESTDPHSRSRMKALLPLERVRSKPLIVFADDSAIATMTMLNLLREAGYDVVTASNGAAAIRAIQEHRPDLALLDVDMPEMTGTLACEHIKQDVRLSRIPVVLMTAHDDPRHLRDGFRAGCDGYITKGTEDDEVLRKIALKLKHGISIQSR